MSAKNGGVPTPPPPFKNSLQPSDPMNWKSNGCGRRRSSPHWMAPFYDGCFFFTNKQSDFWTDGFLVGRFQKKVLNGFFIDCQKKFLTDYFGHLLEQYLGKFRQLLAILGTLCKIEIFLSFFGPTVNSDCLADQFGGRLEISTTCLCGWLRGLNRWRLRWSVGTSLQQVGTGWAGGEVREWYTNYKSC